MRRHSSGNRNFTLNWLGWGRVLWWEGTCFPKETQLQACAVVHTHRAGGASGGKTYSIKG